MSLTACVVLKYAFFRPYIKDSSLTVGDFVKNNDGEIVKAIRYQVGEGIEKKEEDFASEVMSQINNA